jgi:hypothetical protein
LQRGFVIENLRINISSALLLGFIPVGLESDVHVRILAFYPEILIVEHTFFAPMIFPYLKEHMYVC